MCIRDSPITASDNSCDVKIAIVAIVAPRVKLPVSPINTLAGFELYTRKPIILPISIKQKIPISLLPSIHQLPIAIKPKAKKAIADNPPAKPSNPSVKLTALEDPTNKNKMNTP